VLGKSPLAGLSDEATLSMKINREDNEQKLHILKGTAKLFEMVSPGAKASFHRTQTMAVRVAMADSEHFKPRNFKVTAKIALEGKNDAAQEYELLPEAAPPGDHKIDFVLRIPLTELESPNSGEQRYAIAVSIKGIPAADGAIDHALSGSQHDLPGRTFSVENKFILDPLTDVKLSDKKLTATISVAATRKNIVDELTLGFSFDPPTLNKDGKTTRLDNFIKVEPDNGKLTLKKGKGKITITLVDVGNLNRDNTFSPGQIKLTGPEGIVMTPASPAANVSLKSERSQVELTGIPNQLTNPERTKTPLKVSLEAGQTPVSSALKVSLEPVDPNKEGGKFDKTTLWLSKSASDDKTQSIEVKLDEPFFIEVNDNTRGEKLKGVFDYRIRVESEFTDPVVEEFSINVKAPRIVISEGETSVYLSRGDNPQFEVDAWLTSSVAGRKEKAYVKDLESGQSVAFSTDAETGGRQMVVHCPDKLSSVELQDVTNPDTQSDRKRRLNFRVEVPDDIPYGHYWRDFEIVGDDIVGKRFRINIYVDGIEVYFVAGKDDAGNPKYVKKDGEQFIQQFKKKSTRQLLIRTGRKEPISDKDLLVKVIGPFRDDNGDVQTLPTSSTQLVNDNKELLVTVKFPTVRNANASGHPYHIRIVIESGKDTLVAPSVEFKFHVRILDWKQIVPLPKKEDAEEKPTEKTTAKQSP
jgi:hypothetical protein